jgi:thioredoxin 2
MPPAVHVVCPYCDATNRVPRDRLGQGGQCGICHRPLFEGRPVPLNDAARFDKHAQRSDIPVLVDFWATWCGPCRAMAPVFEAAAKRLEPNVRLVKVDSDVAADIAARSSIRSIPTLVLLRRGREIARTSGAMPLDQLVAWVRQRVDTVVA